jgi:lipid II:glycine glycyltransferase (peptidoglycan interpeptide bridge formation enzyme)
MEFQESLGRLTLEYEKEGISARIIKHDLPFKKSYLYIPHGPEMDFNLMTGGFKNPVANFIKWLKETAKNENAIFVKIEPANDLIAQTFAERKFKKSKKEIQPSKTVILNLECDTQTTLDSMHHKTRYNIKVAEKHGVKIFESDDAEIFWKLMEKTTARDKFSSHPKDYYFKLLNFFSRRNSEIKTKLFLAKINNKPIAGAITLSYGDTAYYLHGASDYEFRGLMAPFLLHWHIINYFKKKGLKNYDLWGIDSKKWPGVTRFKLGWIGEGNSPAGRVIERPGSFDLPISKLWYMLYKLFRKAK